MDVGVVGAGRVGTALAVLLRRAGYAVVALSGRRRSRERAARFLPDAPFVTPDEAASRSEVLILAVPDDAIEPLCRDLRPSFRRGTVVHLSGSLGLAPLAPAEEAGAAALSLHPLQTFPTVEAALERLPGSAAAVTARTEQTVELGERLARDAGCQPFRIPEERKPVYHAAAVFASNYVTVVTAVAERLFRAAGVEEPLPAFAPLARAALENAFALSPEAALTGPAVRGDAGTLRRNLEALKAEAPDLIPVYVELARAALELGADAGRLDAAARRAAEEVLDGWR